MQRQGMIQIELAAIEGEGRSAHMRGIDENENPYRHVSADKCDAWDKGYWSFIPLPSSELDPGDLA